MWLQCVAFVLLLEATTTMQAVVEELAIKRPGSSAGQVEQASALKWKAFARALILSGLKEAGRPLG